MKRYQLIRKYPGSPELGTIVHSPHKIKSYGFGDEYKMNNSKNTKNWIFYSKDYIEKYPKFWKKL
jgi:hypothetical protein